MTIGLHWLKIIYMRHIGFYNGGKMIKLVINADANVVISDKIKSGEPLMIARYGSVEFRNLTGDGDFDTLHFNAGFFPNDKRLLGKFREEYMKSSRQIDFLCIWNYGNHFFREKRLMKKFPNIKSFFELGAVGHDQSWVKSLEGKRVLVIHPFKESIESQYKKGKELGILPKLKNLEVIKAVQTIAGNKDKRFNTWFDALDYMKGEIDKKDFDVALIGCGAYGLPLAAYVKSIGKQGIHVGGALQTFFGIKGRRWDNFGIYNKYWSYPLSVDVPKGIAKVEDGCYWGKE